jgi:hypothetical protein
VLAALLSSLSSLPAVAQPRPRPAASRATGAVEVEGAVLAIQGEDLVLDLGSSRGAADGMSVEIWRPLKLKHPVTGKVLTDRFRIGTLDLVQVRGTMSLGRAAGALARAAEVGDVVILARRSEGPAPAAGAGPPAAERPPAPPGDERAASPEDADARAVTEMFDALKGSDLWTRVRRYEEVARSRPEGRFARVLSEEAAALRELLVDRGRAQAESARVEVRSFAPPEEAVAGSPLRIALEMRESAMGAVLHLRRKGMPSYSSLPMSPIGNGYFAALVPGELMVAPRIEYFIEGVSSAGKATPVEGTPDSPRSIEVFEPPRPAAPRHIPARVELLTDYADYNRFRHNDYAWQTEGWFGVRYGDTGVRALRTGFGVYRGRGGAVDDLDKRGLAPREVGFTYGYLEAEFGFVRAFSVIGRAAVGLLDEGISGGGQVMLRIGSDLKTNLLFGGEFLNGVGLRGITQLELAAFERVPILLRTEVTNQPAGVSVTPAAHTSTDAGSIGGRGIVQVGLKITPDLVIALRGSFQGRTIQHAGPGFGGGVGYTW